MAHENKEKRERSSNFTFDDTELLVSLVEEKKAIVECKKTDAVCNKTKDLEWEKLAVIYNARATEVRPAKMLRSKWDALKKASRKEVAALKQHRLGTGGGPANKIKKSPWTDRIICILGIGAVGTVNAFDSDHGNHDYGQSATTVVTLQPEPEVFNPPGNLKNIPVVVEGIDGETYADSDWAKWNPTLLRQPPHEGLRVEVREVLEHGSPLPSSSSTTEVVALDTSITRRRPTLKKRSSSSPAADTNKKFSALADAKLELVKIQIELARKESEARLKLEAEKHVLQMKILEAELKITEQMLNKNKE